MSTVLNGTRRMVAWRDTRMAAVESDVAIQICKGTITILFCTSARGHGRTATPP